MPPSPKIDEIKYQLNPLISFTYIASQILLAMYRASQILIPILPLILTSIPFLVQHHAFLSKMIVISVPIIAGYFQYISIKQEEAREQTVLDLEQEMHGLNKQLKHLKHALKHPKTELALHEPRPPILVLHPASISALPEQNCASEKRFRNSV